MALHWNDEYGIGALSWPNDYFNQFQNSMRRYPILINANNDAIRGKLYEPMMMRSKPIGIMRKENVWII